MELRPSHLERHPRHVRERRRPAHPVDPLHAAVQGGSAPPTRSTAPDPVELTHPRLGPATSGSKRALSRRMEAAAREGDSRPGTGCSSSRSGTAFAACWKTTAASSRCGRATRGRCSGYFPELRPLGELLPPHSALDGEIVIARDGVLSTSTRCSCACIRRSRASASSPPRSPRSSSPSTSSSGTRPPVHGVRSRNGAPSWKQIAHGFHLSPTTTDAERAQAWLDSFEAAGLDGVIAREARSPLPAGSRDGVLKVKPYKTADCVIVGLRWKEKPPADRHAAARPLQRRGARSTTSAAPAVAASKHAQIAERVLPVARRRAAAGLLRTEPLGHRRAGASGSCPSSSPRCATTRCRGTASGTDVASCASVDDKDPKQCTWREVGRPAARTTRRSRRSSQPAKARGG